MIDSSHHAPRDEQYVYHMNPSFGLTNIIRNHPHLAEQDGYYRFARKGDQP